MVRQIQLTESNSTKAEELARRTGKSPDELVNEAFATSAAADPQDEHQKFLAWREAALRVAGIRADRDDLPDFEELRKSWDRSSRWQE